MRPSIFASRTGRSLLFGSLYFVQGAILAYVYVFNSLYLRAFGASAQQLSLLTGLLVIPFVLKIGIGIHSDRVNLLGRGHRLPYIMLGLALMTVGSLSVIGIHPVERYPLFVVIAFLIAVGLAVFDTAVDGMAVDVTPQGEQGTVQGVMAIGRSLGFVSLALAYGRLIEWLGWDVVFLCLALFSALPLTFLWRLHEPAERPASRAFDWQALRSLARPEVRHLLLYAIIHAFVLYGANNLIPLYLNEELGQSLGQVGATTMLASAGMVVGGLLATYVVRRYSVWVLGRGVAGAAFVVLLAIGLPAVRDHTVVALIIWGICFAAADLVYVTMAMMRADPRLGAGTFAVYMAWSNIFVGIGAATVQRLIDTVDYRWQFWGLAALSLLLYPLLTGVQRDEQMVAAPPDPLAVES